MNLIINDCRFISKATEWGENDHWWMLSTINKSFLRFRLKTQGQTTTTLIASQGDLKLGEWQHAAATWDGTTMRLHRNAVEVASVAKAGSAVATDPAVKAAIGSQPRGAYATDPLHANKFFDGRIDKVRIYGYALSQAQLQELIQGLHPTAWKPDPASGTEGVLQPLLRWSASDTGVMHDVYCMSSSKTAPGMPAQQLTRPRVSVKEFRPPDAQRSVGTVRVAGILPAMRGRDALDPSEHPRPQQSCMPENLHGHGRETPCEFSCAGGSLDVDLRQSGVDFTIFR